LQYEPFSRRIYLMKIGEVDPRKLTAKLDAFAHERGYTKIFAKLPKGSAGEFLENGYVLETSVPGCCRGERAVAFSGAIPLSAPRKINGGG